MSRVEAADRIEDAIERLISARIAVAVAKHLGQYHHAQPLKEDQEELAHNLDNAQEDVKHARPPVRGDGRGRQRLGR